MTVDNLPDHLRTHWPDIRNQLLQSAYKPQPVKRVAIPKPGGGTRKLGIPTVLDRFIQQAVLLNAGVMENGLVGPTDEGTPQGGPLSPLLSNLMLDDIDCELERRGYRFVRYADDCNIYVKSRRAGERVMESVGRYLSTKLNLTINKESAAARPVERKFLGFSFTTGKTPKRRIAPQALLRFKERIREKT